MKRWLIIRHVRWLYRTWEFKRFWDRMGKHLGAFPNPSDIAYLDAIWKGKI